MNKLIIRQYALVIVLLLVVVSGIYAQNNSDSLTDQHYPPKIDSLYVLLSQSNSDLTTFNLDLQLGKEWEQLDFDSALIYFNKALQLSEKNDWEDEKARTLINIGFAYYYSNREADKLFEYLHNGLKIYQLTGNKHSEMNTHYNLGYFYGTFEDIPKSIEHFKKTITIAIELNNDDRLSGAYNNIGLMYNYSGMYDKANEFQFKALELAERMGENTAYIHMNIALNYFTEKNFRKSLQHNFKSLALFHELDNKSYVATGYKNIGDNYAEMFLLDSAEYFYNKSYLIYKELGNQRSIARYHMVMGNIKDKRDMPLKAKYQYQLALETNPESGSQKLRFAIFSNLCDINMKLADTSEKDKVKLLNQVINYAREMLQIALDFESIKMEADANERLYKANVKLGFNKSALKYAKRFILMKDSLFSVQKQNAITEMQTKYETEKKEQQILSQKNEIYQKELILNYERNLRKLFIGGTILLIMLIIIISRFLFKSKKLNRVLIEQNEIILKQKEEKEILVKEIHHRTKNNLQIISSLFDMQLRATNNPDAKAALIDGLNRVKSVGLIHQLLYQSEDVININFNDFVNKLIDHICNFSSQKAINKTVLIPSGIQFDIKITLPLGLIINELMTNAFKYAFEEVESCDVSVTLKEFKKNHFNLCVRDNGIGLPHEFDFNASKSLGLRLVHTLTNQLNGKIEYTFDNGANFLLTFNQ